MGCKWPEHHGSDGSFTSGGGVPWPLLIAVAAVALLAPLVGVIIHVVALVLTFTGIATLAGGGGWVWWRLTHRRPQLVYRPQMTPVRPRWRPGLPQDQPQAVQAGPQLHLHLPESPAGIAEAMRQIRGGR